jgi:hypothetical protein
MARFDKRRLSSLEDKKTSPLKKRRPEYSRDFIAKVRKIREDNPTYSCKKIHAILSCEMDEADIPSAAHNYPRNTGLEFCRASFINKTPTQWSLRHAQTPELTATQALRA